MKLTLIYWNVRGFAEPIKMLLEYLHTSYEEIKLEYDEQKPIEASAEQWTKIKETYSLDFHTLPCLLDFEHKVYLSHTIAICKYLAQLYRPKMVGSAMNECAEIDALLYLGYDVRNSIIEGYEKGWEENKGDTIKWIKNKLGYVNKFMKSRVWMSGKQATIADFYWCELLEFIQSADSTIIEEYPNYKKLLRKLYVIPEVQKYKTTQMEFNMAKYLKFPFQHEQ